MGKTKKLKDEFLFAIALLLTMLFSVNCHQKVNRKNVAGEPDSDTDHIALVSKDNVFLKASIDTEKSFERNDTASQLENAVLTLIENENEFILPSKNLRRVYSSKNKLLYSYLVYSNHELDSAGYVDFQLQIHGNIQDQIDISYTYNIGQASHGFGYVMGEDSTNLLHTLKSCGISACVIQVFESKKKIFEKENPN